jgi:penicillin-insensitive murein endopeptidase
VKIKKVIFKINLKDNLFKSKIGKKLKKSGIYFVKYLTPMVDNVHDDHYHIDFEL